jgi:hypothetical protein
MGKKNVTNLTEPLFMRSVEHNPLTYYDCENIDTNRITFVDRAQSVLQIFTHKYPEMRNRYTRDGFVPYCRRDSYRLPNATTQKSTQIMRALLEEKCNVAP